MATRKVYPTSYVLENAYDKEGEELQTEQMKDPLLELVKVWPKMNPTKKQQVSRHTERELKLDFKLPMQKNSFLNGL